MRYITVDDEEYKVDLIYATLVRKFSILEGDQGGQTLDGTQHRDILGTNYEYELAIEQDPDHASDYDRLYEVLSSPVESHIVSFPYGQRTVTFDAMITEGEDTYAGKCAGVELWTGLKIRFVSQGPTKIHKNN